MKNNNENIPAIIGDKNHDTTIYPILSHTTAPSPAYANENPTIAPIIECVVDTGHFK